MCGQTEMYLEMSRYDDDAAKGEVHVRGIAHNEATCPKCIRDKKTAKTVSPGYFSKRKETR